MWAYNRTDPMIVSVIYIEHFIVLYLIFLRVIIYYFCLVTTFMINERQLRDFLFLTTLFLICKVVFHVQKVLVLQSLYKNTTQICYSFSTTRSHLNLLSPKTPLLPNCPILAHRQANNRSQLCTLNSSVLQV